MFLNLTQLNGGIGYQRFTDEILSYHVNNGDLFEAEVGSTSRDLLTDRSHASVSISGFNDIKDKQDVENRNRSGIESILNGCTSGRLQG